MQCNREILKAKAKKLAKTTMAGPGKFAVFIIICIFIIAAFESLGLSNREVNLERRSVPKVVIKIQKNDELIEQQISDFGNNETLNKKLKITNQIEIQEKVSNRDNIMLTGALDQFFFENAEKVVNLNKMDDFDKRKQFFDMILVNAEAVYKEHNDDLFFIDV